MWVSKVASNKIQALSFIVGHGSKALLALQVHFYVRLEHFSLEYIEVLASPKMSSSSARGWTLLRLAMDFRLLSFEMWVEALPSSVNAVFTSSGACSVDRVPLFASSMIWTSGTTVSRTSIYSFAREASASNN